MKKHTRICRGRIYPTRNKSEFNKLNPCKGNQTIHIKGMTLTEIMMTVAILGVILAGLTTFLTNYTRFQRLNNARIEIQRSARYSLDLMNRNIRQAQASSVIVDSAASSEPQWSRIYFTTITGNTVYYYQSSNKLYQVINGTTAELSKNLRNMQFSYPSTDDDAIIGISICFEKATYEGATKALQLSIEKVRIMN